MSNASPQVVNYLQHQLSRNPVSQGGDIIALRAKAFKLNKTRPGSDASSSAPTNVSDRQRVKRKLERIRSACFTGDVADLQNQINHLSLEDHPDLAALGKRLQIVLNSRGKLPALLGDKRFDGDFFSCLKKVLVEPSRDVAVLREQVLSSFRHRTNRKRGQAMICLIKEELPALYELEHDWLESLLRFNGRSAKAAVATSSNTVGSSSGSSSSGWPIWMLIFLIGPLARGCIRIANMDSPSKSRSSYSAPSNYTPPRSDIDPTSSNASSSAAQRIEELNQQMRELRESATSGLNPPDSFNSPANDAFERMRKTQEESRQRMEELRQRSNFGRGDPFDDSSSNDIYTPRTIPSRQIPSRMGPSTGRSPSNIPRPNTTRPTAPGYTPPHF
ncbi:hypothetical protein [Aeoliella mucimassa]|uniref:Uncharacterized protein n=1 Tax=Aeoliella mucimassa TaxID=2527972 RepID=A0A518ATI8_9BACT|nr:hypothetical protein [Aeoliella mucimassa]QDU58032.1 hypothetical protein Pan181_42580 [Aeoliella mucimassa]